MTISFDIERELRAVPARQELAEIYKLRAVHHAAQAGWTQQKIAALLGVEQPEVSRLLQRARLNPAALERTPREILLQHASGEITHDQMLTELRNWEYTYGTTPADDPIGEIYCPGTWDQIERAGDLLTDDDYQRILDAVEARKRRQ